MLATVALTTSPVAAATKSSSPLSDESELPPGVMEPVYNESGSDTSAPTPKSTSDSMREAEAPLELQKTEQHKNASEDAKEEQVQDVLDNPSRSVDEYERVRKDRLHQTTIMKYSLNVTLEPAAFSKIDLRIPAPGSTAAGATNPGLFGVMIGYDLTVFKAAGIAMVGIEGGLYASTQSDPYSGLMFGFMAVRPNVRYEAAFLPKQWVVPTAGFGMEMLRYNYSVTNQHVSGFKTMPRFDVGLLFFLNVLEPSSAADMDTNWGIKKTYLSAFYSVANDTSKKDFNMSENQWRFGFRFEH